MGTLTKRLLVAFLIGTTLGFLLGPVTKVEAASTPCFGDPLGRSYPEARIYVNHEAWWTPTPGNGQISHLHMETCFPLQQVIDGVVHFDVRLVMFNTPGKLFTFNAGCLNNGGCGGAGVTRSLNLTCATGQVCETTISFDMNLSGVAAGHHEFRFKPRIRETDGKVQLVSNALHACVRTACSPPSGLVARGWYEGHGYQNPVFKNIQSVRTPVSGIWTPIVQLNKGADGKPVTRAFASIDANFHMGQQGIVVLDRSSAFEGQLSIDTRTLSNGLHRLHLRVEGGTAGGTNMGVQVVPFWVSN